jgi:hypothetical protein
MASRQFTKADVAAVLLYPSRGVYAPKARDRIEHYGLTSDGRKLNVVTNRAKTIVITVIEE